MFWCSDAAESEILFGATGHCVLLTEDRGTVRLVVSTKGRAVGSLHICKRTAIPELHTRDLEQQRKENIEGRPGLIQQDEAKQECRV